MLGILFTELGPLIFTAGILVTTNLLGGLSSSEDAFRTRTDLRNQKTELNKNGGLRRIPTVLLTHSILPPKM